MSDPDVIIEKKGVKVFTDIESMCRFLLWLEPKYIAVQSGRSNVSGEHVYELHWMREDDVE